MLIRNEKTGVIIGDGDGKPSFYSRRGYTALFCQAGHVQYLPCPGRAQREKLPEQAHILYGYQLAYISLDICFNIIGVPIILDLHGLGFRFTRLRF